MKVCESIKIQQHTCKPEDSEVWHHARHSSFAYKMPSTSKSIKQNMALNFDGFGVLRVIEI